MYYMKTTIELLLALNDINPDTLTITEGKNFEGGSSTRISNDRWSIVVNNFEPNTYGVVRITTIGIKDNTTDMWTGYDYLGKTDTGDYLGELLKLFNQYFK